MWTAPRERVWTSLDLFVLGTFALASLTLMASRIKNGSVCVVAVRTTYKAEQQVCIKDCQTLGKTCLETYDMIKMAFGELSMSYTGSFFNGFALLKKAKHLFKATNISGLPSTSRNSEMIDKVRASLQSDRRLMTREMSEGAEFSVGLCHAVVTEDTGMRWVVAKFVVR